MLRGPHTRPPQHEEVTNPTSLELSPPRVISFEHDPHPPRLVDRPRMSRITYLLHPLMVFGLVLVTLLWGDGAMPQPLQSGLLAAMWAHVLVSLYIGRFDRLRTRTYLPLVFAMLAAQVLSFAKFMLPWGQMAFWLASVLPVATTRLDAGLVGQAIIFALLVIDVMVMQRWAGAISRVMAIAMAALTVAVVIRSAPNLAAAVLSSLNQFDVIPQWSLRPGYSILRAVPDKAMGVAALAAALAVPLFIPWIPAERFRLSRYGWLWLLNCLALAATCLALGYLGGRPPDDGIIRQSQFATAAYFVLFLGVPLILKMSIRKMSKHIA
jgi:quinol-cytochrome oxidoreductase complex cytochrome b subunit